MLTIRVDSRRLKRFLARMKRHQAEEKRWEREAKERDRRRSARALKKRKPAAPPRSRRPRLLTAREVDRQLAILEGKVPARRRRS